MNLLLDTNVVIDYLGRKEPFFADAELVIAAGFFGDATLWMSAQTPKDAFYVLNKYVSSSNIQNALLNLYDLITPVSLSSEELIKGARLQWKDYEDCLISLAAQKTRADYIITRDIRGFERSSVPALSPSEFLVMMKSRGIEYDTVELE